MDAVPSGIIFSSPPQGNDDDGIEHDAFQMPFEVGSERSSLLNGLLQRQRHSISCNDKGEKIAQIIEMDFDYTEYCF